MATEINTPEPIAAVDQATAVLYLRVSTDRQVRKDYDPEGYSIPSQREAGEHRAETLDAVVVRCYTEYGETGRNTRRPALQLMLAELATLRPTYVIVYDLSRLARNRLDDATLLMEIESMGAKLVSVAESIDATPAGRLMHGVLASVNEFRSLADGEKVKLGLARKHAGGGSMGPAKLGYLNVIEMVEGREVRTIVVDDERARLIKEAFELCASGDYSLLEICELLDARGLRSRPTATRPSIPIGRAVLHRLLRDDYYVGVVTLKGVKRPGRHPRLIDPELFDRVQDVLTARRHSGERNRKHQHYLKGTIYCFCGRRLMYGRHRGKTGVYYEYFSCTAKRNGEQCDGHHMPIDLVEDAVTQHYGRIILTEEECERVRGSVVAQAERRSVISNRESERHTRTLAALKDQAEQAARALLRRRSRSGADGRTTGANRSRAQSRKQVDNGGQPRAG